MCHRTALGVSLQAWQPWVGINAIMFFFPILLSQFFDTQGALYGNLGMNIANALATLIAVFGVDRCGRISLFMVSGFSMVFCHACMIYLAAAEQTTTVGMAIIGANRLSPQLSPVPLLLVHRWNGPLERLARRPHLPLCGELRVRLGAPAMVGLL